MKGVCPLATARAIIANVASKKKFDAALLSAVEPVAGKAGNVIYEMCVLPEHTNDVDTLHGGASAYLVDALTTISHVTLDKPPGVSVELQTRFMRSVKVGSTILIETETQKSGRNLFFSNVIFKDKVTGKYLVHGTHTKYVGDDS